MSFEPCERLLPGPIVPAICDHIEESEWDRCDGCQGNGTRRSRQTKEEPVSTPTKDGER